MKCRRAQQLLFDFIDGIGDEPLRAELDRHLGECPACEKFAAEMTRSLSVLRRAPRETLDENFNWRVRLAIHRERNAIRSGAASAGSWARAWNVRYAVGVGVAFGVVLAAGVGLERSGLRPLPSASLRATASSPAEREAVLPPQVAQPSAPSHQRSLSSVSPLVNPEGTLVSEGTQRQSDAGAAAPGAIDDPRHSEAIIDSLMELQLTPLAPAERALFLQRQIHRLQSRLQSQQASPVEP